MLIGLIDVDRKHNTKTPFPNIALCKIARYHIVRGDEVEWAKPKSLFDDRHYDILYASKIFNFSPDIDYAQYSYDTLEKGGTGYDVKKVLPAHIDRLQPYYDIYPTFPKNYAIGRLTTGCPNKCPWCVVPTKEGKIKPYMDIEEIATQERNHIILIDNNILAASDYAIQQLNKIIDLKLHIDFNQAMDARLVTPQNAKIIAKIRWMHSRIRFACDTTAQIAICERAIQMINDNGFKGEYFLYTMIGGKNNLEEGYNRTIFWWNKLQEFRENKIGRPVYIHVQPYRNPFGAQNAIPQWQKDMARWANRKEIFCTTHFKHYQPRKNFKCEQYFTDPKTLQL